MIQSERNLEGPKVYSNPIPRRRKEDEPVPRRHVYTRPVLTLAPEALIEVTKDFIDSPELARSRLPWLRAMNAIAASRNAEVVKDEILGKIEARNSEVSMRLGDHKDQLKESENEIRHLTRDLTEFAIPLGFGNLDSRATLDFAEDEPVSLAILAGRHGLPVPTGPTSKLYKVLPPIGGGAVFGISLGLLAGKLELFDLASEWPLILFWSLLGMTVMAMVGATLSPMASGLGQRLYVAERRRQALKPSLTVVACSILAVLAFTYVRIESLVERLGIFKAIAEQTSLAGQRISAQDLGWVSLMLVVPVVMCYMIQGFYEGERAANLAFLRSLQEEERARIRADERFPAGCLALAQLQEARAKVGAILRQIDDLTHGIQSEPSQSDAWRIEDMEMDAAGAGYEVEDIVRSLCHRGVEKPGWIKRLAAMLFPGLRRTHHHWT